MYQSYNVENQQLNKEIEGLQKNLQNNIEKQENIDFCNLLEQIINFEVIPKQILVKLIDKIEIFKDKSVKIHYKFPRP